MATLDQKIAHAERIFGYEFSNKHLCAEAIQMAAPQEVLSVEGRFGVIENNKRLSVLGDAALALALCKMWYEARDNRGKPLPPSAWTDIRNDFLGNSGLARRGEELGLPSCVYTSPGYWGPPSPKMVAATFEAIVGAIFQDGGEKAVLRAIEHLGLDQHPHITNSSSRILKPQGPP